MPCAQRRSWLVCCKRVDSVIRLVRSVGPRASTRSSTWSARPSSMRARRPCRRTWPTSVGSRWPWRPTKHGMRVCAGRRRGSRWLVCCKRVASVLRMCCTCGADPWLSRCYKQVRQAVDASTGGLPGMRAASRGASSSTPRPVPPSQIDRLRQELHEGVSFAFRTVRRRVAEYRVKSQSIG